MNLDYWPTERLKTQSMRRKSIQLGLSLSLLKNSGEMAEISFSGTACPFYIRNITWTHAVFISYFSRPACFILHRYTCIYNVNDIPKSLSFDAFISNRPIYKSMSNICDSRKLCPVVIGVCVHLGILVWMTCWSSVRVCWRNCVSLRMSPVFMLWLERSSTRTPR